MTVIIGVTMARSAAAQTTPRHTMDDYPLTADSLPQPNVPKGHTFEFELDTSTVFPGTHRKISVYVPAQYTADKPACVYIGLDGLSYHANVVFDNLIAKKQMPITIGIGVHPGELTSAAGQSNPRFNRSFEFDSLNDSLGKFILTEVLPAVEAQKTPNGVPIRLSRDPNDWCAGGGSTGGIAAFTLAFQPPSAVRRVFMSIGTFVDMRGGDHYAALIRKTEPLPIRVFMQDGANDQWLGGPEMGDWWMSNQTVERALQFSGYSVEHVWGTGHHDGAHAAQIFPDAMRWLWKDWPSPVTAGESQNAFLQATLVPGISWEAVHPVAAASPTSLASDAQGNLTAPIDAAKAANVADATSASFTHGGAVYFATADGSVWLRRSGGEKVQLDHGLGGPVVIAPTPDGLWLVVLVHNSRSGYSYRIKPDGSVDSKQRFYRLEVPDGFDDSGASGIAFDRDGRMYVGTRMGVQILDRNGRVRAILPLPGGAVDGICFGGADFRTLFVSSAGKIYRRSMKAIGVFPQAEPITLPPWNAG